MKSERDGMEEELMKMLFGEEIGGMCDDGFEGSNDERRIFMEVLYGKNAGNVSKRCVVTGAVKFKMEENKHANTLSYSNCKSSTGMRLLRTKESSGEDVCPEYGCFGCVDARHIKLFNEPPSHENKESSHCLSDVGKGLFLSKSRKVASNGCSPDFFRVGETITCHLVESCSQGIISSCVILRQRGEVVVVDNGDDGEACNKTGAASALGKYVKDVTVSEAIIRPVSQECSVSKLLLNSAITTAVDIPVTPIVVKEGSKESDLSKLGKANVTSIPVTPTRNRETDAIYEADGRGAYNRKRAARPFEQYAKEVTSSKAFIQPVSQESSVSKALEAMPVAPIVIKEGYQESGLLKSDTTNPTSGCTLLMRHRDADVVDEAEDVKAATTTKVANPLGNYIEEATLSKAIMPPITQESFVSKLLPSSNIVVVEEMPVASMAVKQESNEFDLLEPGIANVTSGCVLLRRHREMDIIDEAGYGKASEKTKEASPHEKFVEDVTVTKAIMLPLCQERSVSTLLPNSEITAVEEMPLAPVIDKEGSSGSCPSKSGMDNVTSGCVLLREHGVADSIGEADDGKASSKSKLSSPHVMFVKKITVSKAMAPPVSQVAFVSKLLHHSAISAVEDIPVALAKEGSLESDLLKSGATDATSKSDLEMNLHSCNHEHINLVESSSQDAVSSSVVLKQYRQTDATEEEDNGKCSNQTKRASPLERSVKEVATRKVIMSPVFPGSSASQLLPIGAVTAIQQKPFACTVVKERSWECNPLKSDMANVVSRGHLKRNCRSLFRKHIDLVESFSQGVVSSCEIPKQCREMDAADEVNNGKACNTIEVAGPHEIDVKKAYKRKAIELSVSQESSASKLLLTGAITGIEGKRRALTCIKEGSQEKYLLMTGMVDDALNEDFIRNLRPRLREHISLVLTATGWGVVIRERKHRPSYFDTLFATPKEKLVCKLPKAWRSCGESLFSGGIHSIQKENMREWADVNGFWNDLSITLAYIEKEMQQTEMSLSLAQRWSLLDPFVIVVCIDRRISVLRSGKAVKVVKGVSIVLENTRKMSFRAKKMDRLKNQWVRISGDQVGRLNESSGAEHGELNASKRKTALLGDASIIRTLSNLSSSEDLHMNASLAQKSAIPYLEQSKSQDLKSAESVFMSKTVGCTTQGELAPLDLNVEIDGMATQEVKQQTNKSMITSGHNQQCEQSMIEEQMPSRHPQEEKVCHEMIDLYKDEVLDRGNTQNIFGVAILPELQSSLFHCNPDSEGLEQANHFEDLTGSAFEISNFETECASIAVQGIGCVEEMQKKTKKKYKHTRKKSRRISKAIKSDREHKKVGLAAPQSVESQSSNFINFEGEQEDSTPRNLSRKCYSSMVASVHNGKLLIVNQQSEGSMAKQQMPFIYPHENVCHRVDGNIQEDVLAHEKTQLTKNCSGVVGKIENYLDVSVYQEKPVTAFASKFARGAASTAGLEIGLTKRSKKSRKISEIKTTKSYSEHKFSQPTPQIVDSQNVDLKILHKVDMSHCQFRQNQKYLVGNTRKRSAKTSLVSSSSCQYTSSSRFKKFQRLDCDFKELVSDTNNGKSQIKLKCEDDIDEGSFHCATDESVDPRANKKFPKMKKPIFHSENGCKRLRACPIDDDDLLIAAIIRNKDFSSDSKLKTARKLKSRKGSCKLLVRSPGKGGKMDGKFSMGARTALSWLLDAGVVSLNDVIQYRNPKDGSVVKDGVVTRDGLFCKCCNRLLSVSEFKLHAGFKLYRPCLHLFLESGKPFTLCQLQAWSSEYKARRGRTRQVEIDVVDQNDDSCGICGDGGELICCDNCPSTFHQLCLFAQELPEGNWYCSNCTCKICGTVVNEKEASSSLVLLQCSQCEHKYHSACIDGECTHKGTRSDPWFCGGNCQEVSSGLRSRVGVLNHIADGFSWTLLRCIHSDQKVHSAQRFALMAECNTKLAVALTIMEECFLPMIDPRTGIDMIPHVMYNWGSEFARLNYQGFYTVVLEKGDKLISVASIRVHGVTVAEMPLIATCSEHRRQGMCRRLLSEIEEMLKSFKVQMLVISAIPNLVDTWTSGFGFRPIYDEEREKLNNVNLMVFPGTIMLKKSLNGMEPIETKQTGLDNESSPRTDIAREEGLYNGRNSLVPGMYSAGNSCIVGTDLVENSVLQNCRNLQLEGQPDGQLKHSPGPSCRQPFSTAHAGSECEDVSSVNHCTVRERIKPLDKCDENQFVSTKQVVSNEMPGANATSVVSSNSPKEDFCDPYIGRLSIAEAHSDGGLVAGTVDADNVCHISVASQKNERMDLITQHQEAADGELNQLQSISILGWSSKHVNSLHASAGMNFSAEKALTVASTNNLFVNGKVDASHCWELNNLYASRENLSPPQGTSIDFMEVATTVSGTGAILTSQSGSADAHFESNCFKSIPGIWKKHSEGRIMSCLLDGVHEQQDNASGQESKEQCLGVGKESLKLPSPVLTKEKGGIWGNNTLSDTAAEKDNDDENGCCFFTSTKLVPSALVKTQHQASSLNNSIQAPCHK